MNTLYIVRGSHLDVGFTDPPSEVEKKRVRILAAAVRGAACELPGGKTKELPFEVLHPTEPAILDVDIQLEIVR